MAEKSPHSMAMLLLAKKHPEMSSHEDPGDGPADGPEGGPEDGEDSGLVAAAHDVLSAIEGKDANALAESLEDFFSLCEKEPHEEGPHTSEEPAEEAPEGE